MVRIENPAIDPDRLAQVATLAAGAHPDGSAMCAMEAIAFIAGEPVTDHPACTAPVIAAFIRTWSDGLPQTERDALIRPFLPRLVGTGGSEALERRRVARVADWLVRTHVPAWFHLAKLIVEGDELADLPALQDVGDLASLCDHLKRARKRAAVANLTLRQTGSEVRNAAWDAAHRAAWVTVRHALEAAGPRVLAAGWDAAHAAAYAAARAYGKAPLEPTRRALQDTARELVEDLIAMQDPVSSGNESMP